MSNGNQPATNKSKAAPGQLLGAGEGGYTTAEQQTGYQAAQEPMPAAPTVGPSRFVRQTPTAPSFRFTGGPLPSTPTQYAAAPQLAPGGGFAVPQQGYSVAQMAQMYNPYAAQQADLSQKYSLGQEAAMGGMEPSKMQPLDMQAMTALSGAGGLERPEDAPPLFDPKYATEGDTPSPEGQLTPAEEAVAAMSEEEKAAYQQQLNTSQTQGSGHKMNVYEKSDAVEGGYSKATQDTDTYHFNPQDKEALNDDQFQAYMEALHNITPMDEAAFQVSDLAQSRTGEINAKFDSAFEIQRRRMAQQMASAGYSPQSPGAQQKQQGLNAAFYNTKIQALETDELRVADQKEGELKQNEANIRVEVEEYINFLIAKFGAEEEVLDWRLWDMLDAQKDRFIQMGIDANYVRPYLLALYNEWQTRTGEQGSQKSNQVLGTNQAWSSSTATGYGNEGFKYSTEEEADLVHPGSGKGIKFGGEKPETEEA